ncbi:17588_t:CDS:2, partial [Gigaspora rosea]
MIKAVACVIFEGRLDHSTINSPKNTNLPEMPQHQQAVDNLTSNSKSTQPSYASTLQS